MKRVDHAFRDQIADLIVANDLRIAEFALEKDFIVTDVLRALSQLKHDKFEFVFCGGTCLSKAYGLLERISEDVDVKVVQKQGVNLSRSQRRTAMSSLKPQIIAALESVGFDKQDIKQYARDGNSYLCFDAQYATHFEHSAAMRANMLLELNFTALSLPSVEREIGLLFNALAGRIETDKLKMQCVSLQEALVEKLIALPRRLAMHLADPAKREFDSTLVRHLFDVYAIVNRMPDTNQTESLKPLLLIAMDKDARDFSSQHPQFLTNPIEEMKKAMRVARDNVVYKNMYESFVDAMVYGDDIPSFDAVLACFNQVLMSVMPPCTLNFSQYKNAVDPDLSQPPAAI